MLRRYEKQEVGLKRHPVLTLVRVKLSEDKRKIVKPALPRGQTLCL